MEDYTLVGGSALTVHLGHRISEDLDFMYDGNLLKSDIITKFIQNQFKGNYKLIKKDNDHQLDFIINNVKVTFFTTDSVFISFNVKEHSVKFGFLNIATIDIIAILKLNAIAQRNTIRDYYDLYYITKNVTPLAAIFINGRELLPHLADITYSETIVYVDDLTEDSISDHLQPKENITKRQISDYFTEEIKNHLIKKT